MEPTRLYLIRHGRVDPGWSDRIYGDKDVPLAPEGEREAARAAARLAGVHLDAVVSSGLQRTEFCAAILRETPPGAGRELPRRDEPDLRELNRGEWVGLRLAEMGQRHPRDWARWQADPEHQRPPGGESLGDVAGRVLPCLGRLAAEYPGGAVAVVAHSWVVRIAVCHALDLPLVACHRFDLPTGEMAVVDWPVEQPADAVGGASPVGDPAAVVAPRPVLVAFAPDHVPDRSRSWNRGPHRG